MGSDCSGSWSLRTYYLNLAFYGVYLSLIILDKTV